MVAYVGTLDKSVQNDFQGWNISKKEAKAA